MSNPEIKNPLKKPSVILGFLVLFALIISVGFLIWSFFRWLFQLPSTELNPVLTSTIPALVAIITSSATVYAALRSKKAEKLKEIEFELRKQKAPLYEEFTGFIFQLLKASKKGEEISEDRMLDFVMRFNQRLIVWGSDELIKEWGQWTKGMQEKSPFEMMLSMEKMLFAIRADMGQSNKNLQSGDLLSVFVTDIDQYLQKGKSN